MSGMDFILIFDLPREQAIDKVRINRALRKIKAKMIQFSVWESKNLQDLIYVATLVKKSGGEAKILEERFVF